MVRFVSKKTRLSTKDRFVSVLRPGSLLDEEITPWYRRRGNFFTLLVIFGFFLIILVIKGIYSAQILETKSNNADSQHTESIENDNVMDYEEAKRIFSN